MEQTERETHKKQPRNLFKCFSRFSVRELEDMLLSAGTREERAFYRTLINLKLQIEQEKIVGETLI